MNIFIIKSPEGIEYTIPNKYKQEVLDMIKSKCYKCLEQFLIDINLK